MTYPDGVLTRWRRWSVLVRDGVCAVAFAVLLLVLTVTTVGGPTVRDWALITVTAGAVAVRRTYPVASWLVLVGLTLVELCTAGGEPSGGLLGLLMGAYTIVAYGPRWCGVAVVLPISAVIAAAPLLAAPTGEESLQIAVDVLTAVVTVALATGLGSVVRTVRQTADQLAEQGERLRARNSVLEHLRIVEAENAALTERARIAREVHDVLAHHMVAIQIHAQVATRFSERQPDKARVALEHLLRNGVAANDALRRLLSHPAGSTAAGPQPALTDLPDLVLSLAPLGVEIDLRLEDPTPPPDVQSAIYRVVQEALTNAVRHGGCRRARVVVRRLDQGDIGVTVDDDGRAGVDPAHVREAAGHGLRGMRERVALHGGGLDLSVGELGGWRVGATFRTAPS